jgi:hypothetical protein
MLGFVCALLLFAQQLGVSHAVWHASQQLPANAAALDDAGDLPTLPHASKLCPLDAVLGQVLGGAAVSSFTFVLADAGAQSHAAPSHTLVSTDAPVARSRGPPALS